MFRGFVLICIIVMLTACTPLPAPPAAAPPTSAPPTASPATVPATESGPTPGPAITLIRSGGLAGKVVQWDIYLTGRSVSGTGKEATLSSTQVATVVSEIEKLGFFEMTVPGSKTGKCADCYVVELRVRSGAKDKTLTFTPEISGTPTQLLQILEKLDGLLQALPKE